MNAKEKAIAVYFIVRAVKPHGCRLIDLDLDAQRIEFEGPEDKQSACALALAKALGD